MAKIYYISKPKKNGVERLSFLPRKIGEKMAKFAEKDIEKLMKNLEISRDEAIQVLIDDEADTITPEVKELEKKAKSVTRGMAKSVDAYGKTREREKKVNIDKTFLINTLSECCADYMPKIVNPEREFTFTYNEICYKVVMSVPRPPKKAK